MGKIFLGLLFSVSAFGLGTEDRVLLIVTSLKQNVPEKFAAIYERAEPSSISLAEDILGNSYQKIHTLLAKNATLPKFLGKLSELGRDEKVKAIDVFIHLHGSPGSLLFFDATYNVEDLAKELLGRNEVKGKLRALYSTACFGRTHAQDFLMAGFRVANGARQVNANSPYEYPTFMKNWGRGTTYATAQERGNAPQWRAFFDGAARLAGLSDADSFKEMFGEKDLRIDE